MANKCLNKVRVWAGDIPNIGSTSNSSCNEPAIRGETAVAGIIVWHIEVGHNCSGINVLNCNSIPIAQGKLSVVWRESNVGTIICGWDLVTSNIPLPDLATRDGDEVVRVCGREADMLHSILLLYGTIALSCLNIPQIDSLLKGS